MLGIFHQGSKHRNSTGIRLLQAPIQGTEGAGDSTVVGAVVAIVGRQGTKRYININEKVFSFQNGAFKRMMGVAARAKVNLCVSNGARLDNSKQ